MKRVSIKFEPNSPKTRKMNHQPSTTSAYPVKSEEGDELERLRQQIDHLQREAEERDDNMDALIEDNRRLTRLVKSLQKDVHDRDAEIASRKTRLAKERSHRLPAKDLEVVLIKTHLSEERTDRSKKRTRRRKPKVQKTPPTVIERIKSCLARLKSMEKERQEADKATLTDNFGTFNERVSCRELMKGSNEAVDSLIGLAASLTEDVLKDQRELDVKTAGVFHFVKGLLEESRNHYANVNDYDDFIAHFYQKLQIRKATLQRLFADVKASTEKYVDADGDDNNGAS